MEISKAHEIAARMLWHGQNGGNWIDAFRNPQLNFLFFSRWKKTKKNCWWELILTYGCEICRASWPFDVLIIPFKYIIQWAAFSSHKTHAHFCLSLSLIDRLGTGKKAPRFLCYSSLDMTTLRPWLGNCQVRGQKLNPVKQEQSEIRNETTLKVVQVDQID